MVFNLTKPKLGPDFLCLNYDVTQESVAALTDHFADAFVPENVARVYDIVVTLESLTLMPFCLEKSSVGKWIFQCLSDVFSAV